MRFLHVRYEGALFLIHGCKVNRLATLTSMIWYEIDDDDEHLVINDDDDDDEDDLVIELTSI